MDVCYFGKCLHPLCFKATLIEQASNKGRLRPSYHHLDAIQQAWEKPANFYEIIHVATNKWQSKLLYESPNLKY